MQTLAETKSAKYGGIYISILQVLHVHILFVPPLDAGYMTQSCTDQDKVY